MAEWRTVPSYPWWQASSDGEVRRVNVAANGRKPAVIPGSVFSTGYRYVGLGGPEGRKKAAVHALVCEAFHGPRPPGAEVAHADGSTTNNRPENLRWTDRSGNAADRRVHGRDTIGTNHPLAKINDDDVREIRRLRAAGLTGAQVGARYGLNRNTINRIASGQLWKHV